MARQKLARQHMTQRIRIQRLAIAGVVVLSALAARSAAAEPAATSAPSTARDSEPDRDLTAITRSVDQGGLLPLTLSPTVASVPATAIGYGGYDGARGRAVGQAFAEVRLWRQLALRGGAELTDASHRLRPTIGARLQVLSQYSHGVDGAVSVFYRAEGFDEPEGEIESVLSVGRRMGRTTLIANLAYGQDPDGNERDGEVRLAAITQIGARLSVGFDGRWRFDLGSQTAKLRASNEPTYDVDAGPVAALILGPIALVAHAGVSVVRRVDQDAVLGVVALAGAGTSF
jgi:hypothetical protein